MNRRKRTSGFTLVELLVVVAIMALLIGIALPAFRGAKNSAKEAGVKALQAAAATAIETFQADQTVGGSLPPSASDIVSGSNARTVRDPYSSSGYVAVSGASLLVLALAGPDNQGTVGFKSPGTAWAEATGGPGSGGSYDLNAAYKPVRGGPFASGKLLESVKPLSELEGADAAGLSGAELRMHVFVDNFNTPLLYYRARKAAEAMITTPGNSIGIYDHQDNQIITGLTNRPGTDVIKGIRAVGRHQLSYVDYPSMGTYLDLNASPSDKYGSGDPAYAFDEFILDRNSSTPAIKAAYRPVRASEYLLISAGKDKIFGTADDVKNW